MRINETTHQSFTSRGFTIIEVIVALAITSLFLTFFFQMYLAMESQRIGVARQALASDLAYSNLRKVTSRPAGLPCDAAKMDLSAADGAAKQGLLLGDQTNVSTPSSFGFLAEPDSAVKSLGGNVQQLVKAYAPRGCTGTAFTDNPVKIESTVIYGSKAEKVIHAVYIN